MKSKINDPNAPSSTASPLSFQERGRGEFAKSRSEFADEQDLNNIKIQCPLCLLSVLSG